MEDIKTVFIKYDDSKKLLEHLKKVMKTYDMDLVDYEGNRYKFDRFGDYARGFIIEQGENGWIILRDQDETQTETLCQELSETAGCFCLCMGIHKELFYYTLFENGVQVDQYLSTLDYYEYPVDEDVINAYKGNTDALASLIDEDKAEEFQNLLENCREGEIEPSDAYRDVQIILDMLKIKTINIEEDMEQEGEEEEAVNDIPDPVELFYVDFESMNIRIDNQDEVIEAIENIASEMGYERVDEFKNIGSENKGFFKKLLNSVSESKRLQFFISPPSEGWITVVGELQILYGSNPTEWNFLNIEDRLSMLTEKQVVNIYGDNEKWGFKVYKDGESVYEHSSDDEFVNIGAIATIFKGINSEALEGVFDRPLTTAEDIDEVMGEFCGMIGVKNYKINIPMDYSEDEFYSTVINRLPDGEKFIDLKFDRKR